MKNSIGIIGYGRFGKILAQLLQNDFDICIYDKQIIPNQNKIKIINLTEIAKLQTIFIAVPIHEFKNTIHDLVSLFKKQNIKNQCTLIDVCSVKTYTAKIMQEYCPEHIDLITTHPLFGPDSLHSTPLKIVMHPLRDHAKTFTTWQNYFTQQTWQVINMTPDEHDQIAANTQAITHFIGRTLNGIHAQPNAISTLGYTKLLEVMEQTCNDNESLFFDMIRFNPYAQEKCRLFLETGHKILEAALLKS